MKKLFVSCVMFFCFSAATYSIDNLNIESTGLSGIDALIFKSRDINKERQNKTDASLELIAKSLGDDYAGSWTQYDADGKSYTVIASTSAVPINKKLFNLNDDLIIKISVNFSEKYLLQIADMAMEYLDGEIYSMGINYPENFVEIGVDANLRASLDSLLKSSGFNKKSYKLIDPIIVQSMASGMQPDQAIPTRNTVNMLTGYTHCMMS